MIVTRRRWLGPCGCAVIACSLYVSLAAQASDEEFKTLYAAAEYEKALEVASAIETFEARLYRALCLTALSRQADAIAATEALITASPTFVPSPEEAPPRFLEQVTRVRKRILPSVAIGILAEGRELYIEKRHVEALERFSLVLTLVADPAFEDFGAARNLKILAQGFTDLAHAAMSPAGTPAAAQSGGARR